MPRTTGFAVTLVSALLAMSTVSAALLDVHIIPHSHDGTRSGRRSSWGVLFRILCPVVDDAHWVLARECADVGWLYTPDTYFYNGTHGTGSGKRFSGMSVRCSEPGPDQDFRRCESVIPRRRLSLVAIAQFRTSSLQLLKCCTRTRRRGSSGLRQVRVADAS